MVLKTLFVRSMHKYPIPTGMTASQVRNGLYAIVHNTKERKEIGDALKKEPELNNFHFVM